MSERPIIVVTGSRRPHELLLLAFSLIAGLAFLLGAPRPASMGDSMGDWFTTLWAFGLLFTGLIGLVGSFWRGSVARGLLLERSAMLLGAGAAMGYAIQVYSTNGGRSLFAAGFCFFWALANVARAVQISNDLRSM